MLKPLRFLTLALLLSGVSLPVAHAQTDGTFALGALVSRTDPSDSDAHGDFSIGLTWRIGHSDSGWGWTYGLNWFTTDIDRSIGGSKVELGKLSVKPFMGGYGYTHRVGRTAISANLLGGYALSSFRLTTAANDAFVDRLGARSVNATTSNTFVVKPEVGAWIDLNKKFGVRLDAGYMIARPQISIRSSLGEDKRRFRADTLMMRAGLVYSLF